MGIADRWGANRGRIHEREDDRSSKIDSATRNDIRRLREDMAKQNKQRAGSQMAKKSVRSLGKGIVDIAKSLNTPNTNQRPRIAQLPESRSSIGISQQINLENMKPKGLRGQDIRGRR
jgi:hypothetical protein